MTRIFAMTALASVAFTAPTLAAEPATHSVEGAAFGSALSNASIEQQARLLLAHQGYTDISPLDLNENGRWVGTAVKDGKTIFGAVAMPSPRPATID